MCDVDDLQTESDSGEVSDNGGIVRIAVTDEVSNTDEDHDMVRYGL